MKNIFHIHSNVFLLFVSSLPHCQADYLICGGSVVQWLGR